MSKDKAIAELVRIWNSPYLDLSLKAGLAEAIDALKGEPDFWDEDDYWAMTNHEDSETLKGEDGDLISRQDAIDALMNDADWADAIPTIKSLPSAEPCDKDAISREGLLRSWEELSPRGRTEFDQVIMTIPALPSAEPKTDEESELRFYYVESIDDYWIGQRLDNFYYADWHEGLGFVWSKSRYLPWGEHIVNENTLWKEHTYPSEPIEIPFTEWIVGFVKKYFAEPKTDGVLEQIRWERDMALKTLEEHGIGFGEKPKTGEWMPNHDGSWNCSECGLRVLVYAKGNYCPNCGADMRGGKDDER